MHELDKQYPQYGLAKNKGYPTFDHRSALYVHGPSPIHRMTYGPVKEAAMKHAGNSKTVTVPTSSPVAAEAKTEKASS